MANDKCEYCGDGGVFCTNPHGGKKLHSHACPMRTIDDLRTRMGVKEKELGKQEAVIDEMREALEFHFSEKVDRDGLLALVKKHCGEDSCAAMSIRDFFEARDKALKSTPSEALSRALGEAEAKGLEWAARFMDADKGQNNTHPSHAGIDVCLEYYPEQFRSKAKSVRLEGE